MKPLGFHVQRKVRFEFRFGRTLKVTRREEKSDVADLLCGSLAEKETQSKAHSQASTNVSLR